MRRLFIKSPQSFQKFILLFLFIFVTYTAFSIGVNLLYSLVLISYGAKAMPFMVLFLGIAELISVILFSLKKNNTKKTAVLNASLFILIVIFLFTYSIAAPLGLSIFFAISFIALQALGGIVIPQFDMIIANLFSVSEFKVIYPKIASAYSISSIVGGLLLAFLSSVYGSRLPLLVIAILLIGSLGLSILIYRLYKTSLQNKKESLALEFKRAFIDRETDENMLSRSKWTFQTLKGGMREVKENLLYLFREKVILQIILFTLIAFTAYRFFSFIFDSFVNMDLSEQEITPFFALLDVILSIGSLIFRLFFSTALLKRISFTSGYILQSTVMVFGLGSMMVLYFFTHTTWLYLLAAVLYILFQITIINRETSENISFSLIPRIHRDKARTLANSLGDSLSYIFSALFIIGIINVFPFDYVLILGFVVVTIYCIGSFIYPKTIYPYIEKLLQSRHQDDLRDVIEVIGERKGKCFTNTLLQLYPQSSIDIKNKILLSLGEFRTKQAYEFLLQQFFKDNKEIYLSLIQALAHYKTNHAFLLMYLIYKKAPPEVLHQAITYLLTRHKKRIRKLISTDFLRSKDTDIKIIALGFIQRFTNKEERGVVLEYTRDYYPTRLIQQALYTLYNAESSLKKYVLDKIQYLLYSKKKEQELAALQLIGDLGIKKMKKQILFFIDNEEDSDIRSRALFALMHVDIKKAVHYFVYYMSHPIIYSKSLIDEYITLPLHLRMKIIHHIMNLPVTAVETAIKYLLPHRQTLKTEMETLYFSISQRFSSLS